MEQWKSIEGHPNYEISSYGRCKSKAREVNGKLGSKRKIISLN